MKIIFCGSMILMCIIICIFLIVCVLSLHDRDDTDDLKSKTCLENPVFGKQPWYWYFYYGIYFSQHVWLMVSFNIFLTFFLISYFFPHFSGTAHHEDFVFLEARAFNNKNIESTANTSENESGTDINWPADFFSGLPCPKFQYPIVIPPKSRNR